MSRHAAVRDPEPLKMDGHKLDRDRQSVGDEVAGTRSRAPSFQSNLWAIADLHLSLARPDRRERYAERWRDHAAKIEREWRTVVRPEDLVLLPGDLSMARNHRDVQSDLAWIDRLPGTKVLAAGNHDSWWNDVDKIRPILRRSLLAVGGDAVATHGVVVCGTLGVPVPADEPSPEQVAASDRELAALDRRARAGRAAPDCSRAALRPLALPPLRPAPPTRSLRRAVRGGRRDCMSLRPPPYPGSMVAGRARRHPGRTLLLRGRRRDRFSTPPHRFTFAMTPRAPGPARRPNLFRLGSDVSGAPWHQDGSCETTGKGMPEGWFGPPIQPTPTRGEGFLFFFSWETTAGRGRGLARRDDSPPSRHEEKSALNPDPVVSRARFRSCFRRR